jgi:hypothetical protein
MLQGFNPSTPSWLAENPAVLMVDSLGYRVALSTHQIEYIYRSKISFVISQSSKKPFQQRAACYL